MALMTAGKEREIGNNLAEASSANMTDAITLGIVVDTNDPQQMGRVRAMCARWGDSADSPTEYIPWAVYASPFGGQTHVGDRGPGLQESKGGVAYGMWAIPKVGAQVLVTCIDGDPNQRVYLGCVFDQYTPHTLPHGRYMYDKHPAIDDDTLPAGPLTSAEQPIEPLHSNMVKAFGQSGSENYEWQSRGADHSASALDVAVLNLTQSQAPDDKDIEHNDWTSRQGYQTSRIDPAAPVTDNTERNFDSMVYSLTSPGFHSVSMDDRIENCRIRIRTTAGNQIILDDTNERIYISTAEGENWIELDQKGNIDIYSSNKLSVRTEQGINFTTDKEIRMYAEEGFHFYTPAKMNFHALDNIEIITEKNMHTRVDKSLYTLVAEEMNLKSGNDMNLTTGAYMNSRASSDIIETASNIHMNGPSARTAVNAQPDPAKWTHKVPAHEPYARTMTKDDFTHAPEFPYGSDDVNRVERGSSICRGLYWRR